MVRQKCSGIRRSYLAGQKLSPHIKAVALSCMRSCLTEML
ncbi:hypothetical protein SK68_02373 [Serratia marcescens]|nr:hypothetical protein SK68_02373 [Serratia marcescens]KMJ12653.1 hypothetical protein SN03_02241 [Serratia marcescens]